jgi:UTP--glucose-1-phosphate uridylyltransferase
MASIKKAVVAVAGSGTRFLPITKTIPKEMLPILDKPIIQLVVEELVAGGIEDIILVTKRETKDFFKDYFTYNKPLEQELEKAGKEKRLKEIKKIPEIANFTYVVQKGPYGNGTPVLSAAKYVKNEPFVYVWGDDLVKSSISFTKQLIEDYEKHGQMVIGVQEVPRGLVYRYGIVKLRLGAMEIEDIIEKPSIEEAPSQLADFGRMILNQEIIDILKNIPLGKDNELWIVDAIRAYVKRGEIFRVKKVEDGEWLTTGDPWHCLKTTLKYAFDRNDSREDLKEFFNNFI